jgi:hypothetical protein
MFGIRGHQQDIEMWLPKDERRLLAGYYEKIGEIDKPHVYRESDLIPLLALRKKLDTVREFGGQ